MIEIIAVRQDYRLSIDHFNDLISCVSDERATRVRRFVRWEDAQHSLISEVLVRSVITKKLRIKNNEIVLGKNDFGKPYLHHHNTIYFNISHSGNWVVAAFADCDVGIDIEQIKLIDLNVAKSYFSKDEYTYLMNLNETERLSGFYELWVSKESYIKAIGMGLSFSLKDFTITIGKHKEISVKETRPAIQYLEFKLYDLDPMHKLSICLSKQINNEIFITISLDDFIKNIYNNPYFVNKNHSNNYKSYI